MMLLANLYEGIQAYAESEGPPPLLLDADPGAHTPWELFVIFGTAFLIAAPFAYIAWCLFVAFMTIPARMLGWFAGETAAHANRRYRRRM